MKALLMNGPADGHTMELRNGTHRLIVPMMAPVAAYKPEDAFEPPRVEQIVYERRFALPNGVVVFDCKARR